MCQWRCRRDGGGGRAADNGLMGFLSPQGGGRDQRFFNALENTLELLAVSLSRFD